MDRFKGALHAKVVVERFGRVDGLVNNAATNVYFGPLLETPDPALTLHALWQ